MDTKNMSLDEIIKMDKAKRRGGRGGARGGRPDRGAMGRFRNKGAGIFKRKDRFEGGRGFRSSRRFSDRNEV